MKAECDEMRHSAYGIRNETKYRAFSLLFGISMRQQLLLLIPNQNSIRVHAKLFPQQF